MANEYDQISAPTNNDALTETVDLQQAREFLALLDDADGFSFQTFDENNNTRRSLELSRQYHGSLDLHAADLVDMNTRGAAVAVCINATDLVRRANNHITRFRAVWCDYDRKSQETPKALDELLASFPLEPSIVVETSPGNFHFYWFVDEMGRLPFKVIMDRLVTDYGGDRNARDPARAMRLPGFMHQKGDPHLVRIIHRSGKRYHREEVRAAFPPIERVVSAKIASADRHVSEEWEREKGYIRDALAHIPADDRNLWFTLGGAIYDLSSGGADGFEIWHEWSARCAEKYEAENQQRYWEREFCSSRQERASVASIYHHAFNNGWPGKFASVSIEVPELPSAKTLTGSDLAIATIASLQQTFEVLGHRPAETQWIALRDLATTLEAMSNGTLEPYYHICSLAPGMGKTQTLVHFVHHLLNSPKQNDVAVIIFVGRIAEIKNLVSEIGLKDINYAVLVTDTPENKALNSSGNRSKTDARVLFTTQQMLESRSRRKAFAEISEFRHAGKPRRVRIWDEAILPAKTLCINISLIEAMTHVVAKSRPAVHKVISSLIDAVKKGTIESLWKSLTLRWCAILISVTLLPYSETRNDRSEMRRMIYGFSRERRWSCVTSEEVTRSLIIRIHCLTISSQS